MTDSDTATDTVTYLVHIEHVDNRQQNPILDNLTLCEGLGLDLGLEMQGLGLGLDQKVLVLVLKKSLIYISD